MGKMLFALMPADTYNINQYLQDTCTIPTRYLQDTYEYLAIHLGFINRRYLLCRYLQVLYVCEGIM